MRKVSLLLVLTMLATIITVAPVSAATTNAAQTITELKVYDFEDIAAGTVYTSTKDIIAEGISIAAIDTTRGTTSVVANPDGSGNVLKLSAKFSNSEGDTSQVRFNFTDAAPAAGETLVTKFKFRIDNWGAKEAFISGLGTLFDVNRITECMVNTSAQIHNGAGTVYYQGLQDDIWYEETRIYDFVNGKYYSIINDTFIETAVPFAKTNDGAAAEKHLRFNMYGRTGTTTGTPTDLYIDDVSAYLVKNQTLSTAIADSNVDMCEAMTVNFQNPVKDAEGFANAVSIKNAATEAVIDASRITTELASDGMSATIKVNDDNWQAGTYVLTIANTFRDAFGILPAAELEHVFGTIQKENPDIGGDEPGVDEEDEFDLVKELKVYDFEGIAADTVYTSTKDIIAEGISIEAINTTRGTTSVVANPDGSGNVLKLSAKFTNSEGDASQVRFNFTDAAPAAGETLVTKFKFRIDNWGAKEAFVSGLGVLFDASRITTCMVNTSAQIHNGAGTVYYQGLQDDIWYEETRIYDFVNGKYYSIINDTFIETAVPFTNANDGAAAEKNLKFNMYGRTGTTSGTPTDLYIDDVSAYIVKTQQVKALIDESNVDINAPIQLKFGLPVADAANVKAAISVKDNTNNAEISSNRISVELAADKLSADVTIEGGLDCNTNYTITVAKSMLDFYRREMAEDYEKTFTTAITDGVRLKAYLPVLTGNKLDVMVNVENPTSAPADAWVVVASYTNANYMIEADHISINDIAAGAASGDVELTLSDISGADYIRLFVWNSSEELKPYHMPVDVIYE